MTTLEDQKLINEIRSLDTKGQYTLQNLLRKPTTVLVSILQDLNDERAKQNVIQINLHNPGFVPPPPHIRSRARTGQHDEKDQDAKAAREETETLPDQSAFQGGTKAKQQFNIFKQRQQHIQQYLAAIKNNTQALEQFRSKLDPDMVAVYENDIQTNQKRIKEYITEIRSIYTWFRDMKAAKADVYRELAQRSIDTEGRISEAFSSQVQEIEEYTKQIYEYLSK